MLATEGEHEFFAAEGRGVRDIRQTPLTLGNYVISRNGKWTLVDIKNSLWKKIAAEQCRSALMEKEVLEKRLRRKMAKLTPYKPIQNRWQELLKEINLRRKRHDLPPIAADVIPSKRWQQKVYAE